MISVTIAFIAVGYKAEIMKLTTFSHRNNTRIGIVRNDEILDTQDITGIPDNMLALLQTGNAAMDILRDLSDSSARRIPLAEVNLLAPVPRPGKYLAISLNYADHIKETGRERPEFPTFFNKQSTCVIAAGEAIHRPRVSEKLDYEGELAMIIGKRCRHVPKQHARNVIAGFTIANDVSVRDWQFRSPTFTLGKSFDTHGPLGPWLVTVDEIGDPHDLNINTWVDDELRQSSNTQNMLFNCYEMIAYLSTVMTLEPGDVISTGTPSGVGVKMTPRGYMKPGQRVKITIEKIGTLCNPVIEEPAETVQY